jgi:hypothetical protein
MEKTLVLTLYVAHLFLMLAGIAFALLYLIQGPETLAEGLSENDMESIISFRWWHVVVGAVYPIFLFVGIHLLFKRKNNAALVYGLGCGIYVVTNTVSYIYAQITQSKLTGNIEDLWFCVLFVCLAALVSFLSTSQATSKNT